jgi:hypothetical protein
MGWMKGWVGLNDPEPLLTEEHPLTVLVCEVVLLLGCVNVTSPAVFGPRSCIPKPANPSFSFVDRDRSSFPWSSLDPDVLRR